MERNRKIVTHTSTLSEIFFCSDPKHCHHFVQPSFPGGRGRSNRDWVGLDAKQAWWISGGENIWTHWRGGKEKVPKENTTLCRRDLQEPLHEIMYAACVLIKNTIFCAETQERQLFKPKQNISKQTGCFDASSLQKPNKTQRGIYKCHLLRSRNIHIH